MDRRNFLLSTDSPLDKVVGFQSGSHTMSPFGALDVLIPHNLGFQPLFLGKWSKTPDFSVSYGEMSALTPVDAFVNFRTNSTNLSIRADNFTNANLTVYWKILYFMPSDINATAAFTQASLDNFNLNTDYNYTKLLTAGKLNAGSGTIPHNLGYSPQVEAWWEDSSNFINYVYDFVNVDKPRASVDTNSLYLSSGTFLVPISWHYRIYVDEL